MSNIKRKAVLNFYLKKVSYWEDQSFVHDNSEFDVSLVWNSIEEKECNTVLISKISKKINIKKEIRLSKYFDIKNANTDYPIIIWNNRIVDGTDRLAKAYINNDKYIKVIYASDKDMLYALM